MSSIDPGVKAASICWADGVANVSVVRLTVSVCDGRKYTKTRIYLTEYHLPKSKVGAGRGGNVA